MKRFPTSADRLTEALKASIGMERIISENHRDIARAQSTRKKIRDLIDKYSPKSQLMKNTIIEIKGVRLAMDLSAMTPTARERFKQSGAVTIEKERQRKHPLKMTPA